jgi:hypothetical protein
MILQSLRMMSLELTIHQCLLNRDAGETRIVAKSTGFPFAHEELALRTAATFGPVPAAVFTLPFGTSHVAVAQASDGTTRFLVLDRALYEALGDPFAIVDRFPPNWNARGELEALEWPPEPLPPRTVTEVQNTLKHGDSPLLLGMTQALIDGSRVLLVRPEPDPELLRGLWQLLPGRTRCDLWPATFANSVELGFHVAIVREAPAVWPVGYLTEEQARDYPEGRYELALQVAAEDGDQAALDKLFARRSSRDTLRLAIYMVAFAFLAAAILKFV